MGHYTDKGNPSVNYVVHRLYPAAPTWYAGSSIVAARGGLPVDHLHCSTCPPRTSNVRIAL